MLRTCQLGDFGQFGWQLLTARFRRGAVFTMRALMVFLALASSSKAADYTYRDPIVFGRGHQDEATGRYLLHSKIWIMERDGSHQRQLTAGECYDDHPSMYPDQRHVLYSEFTSKEFKPEQGARLIKLDIYTGAREVVAEEPGCGLHHASLSPVGNVLAYHRDCGKDHEQWVGWGPGAYRVTTAASNGVALPDSIIFMHEINKGAGNRFVSLARMWGHDAGAKMQFLTGDRSLHRRPAISPDGKQLAWQTNLNGKDDEIYLANLDGSNPRNLTDAPGNDGHPWFSRDGKTLVFESDRTGSWEIWKVDFGSKTFTQLTHGGKKFESTRPRM
jgi:Tol biopolymer transport system component